MAARGWATYDILTFFSIFSRFSIGKNDEKGGKTWPFFGRVLFVFRAARPLDGLGLFSVKVLESSPIT